MEDVAKRLAGGHQAARLAAGCGDAAGDGVLMADFRGSCRRCGGESNRKDIRLEGDHSACAGSAAEQLGRRDESPQHGAGGTNPSQHVEPGAGGAGVVGKLDDGGVVVIHGIADPLGQGEDCLRAAGIQRGLGNPVDAGTTGAIPTDAAATWIGERRAIEKCPDHTCEAEAGEQLRQDRRRTARLLGIRDRNRAHDLPPHRESSLERADDLLGSALVEGL